MSTEYKSKSCRFLCDLKKIKRGNMKIIIKTLLKYTALAMALVLSSHNAMAVDLKLANFMSSNHPYHKLFESFADKVAKATDGKVTVTVFSGGELGPGPVEQYNRVVDGVADLAVGLPGYTASNFPKTLLTELPGVITSEKGTEQILNNIDMLNKEYRRVKLIGLWTNAPNAIYTREKAVRSLEDMKGLKIRVPSRNAGLIVKSWGATPVSMPVPEIYNSMQTGVIDGAFIDGTGTYAFRLSEVTKYITTGMNTSISSFFMLMNRDSFADLSEDQQKAMVAVGKQLSKEANALQLAGAEKGLADFGQAQGKKLIKLSPDAADAFNTVSSPVVDKVIGESKGIDAAAFIQSLGN